MRYCNSLIVIIGVFCLVRQFWFLLFLKYSKITLRLVRKVQIIGISYVYVGFWYTIDPFSDHNVDTFIHLLFLKTVYTFLFTLYTTFFKKSV